MRPTNRVGVTLLLLAVACGWLSCWSAGAAEALQWRKDAGRVDAEIDGWNLPRLLEELAAVTDWQIFVEPNAERRVSTKFKNRTTGDALGLLLGDLSYALLPQTNGPARLFVFKTSLQEATQRVRAPERKTDPTAKPIPNELIVTLKPGASIEALAKKLGAKILGKADGANTYRLSFEDADAAQAARAALESNSDVTSVDSNYFMRRADPLDGLSYSSVAPPRLKATAPLGEAKQPIIGLIDTAVQTSGTKLDEFLLPGISVAGDAKISADQLTHGTAMFETILRGLSLGGQESTVRVLPIDVYGDRPNTTTFDVANGILEAVRAGAKTVNLSLGSGGDSRFLHDVLKGAQEQGVLFFAAAGNEPGTAPTYPAAYPEVNAVTAGMRDGSIAPYANRGDFVDLAAPGSSIVNFQGQPYVVTGTSTATAYASGLAGSLAAEGGRSPEQITLSLQKLLPLKK